MITSLEIESLAYGGDGIAHLEDGRVAFVAGALPGDVVDATIVEDKERFVRCKTFEIANASPHRITSPCKAMAAGLCGGCPWACFEYEQQLQWKRQFVVDALERITKMSPETVEALVGECVASKKQWNYRNKVEFEVGTDVSGRFSLGMHVQGGGFAPLAECQLCKSTFSKIPKALTGALRYACGDSIDMVERVGFRHSVRTGDTEVALWTRTGKFPRANVAKIVADALPAKRPSISRVLLKGSAKMRKVSGVESLAGKGHWTEEIDGRIMRLSAPSFFQVNTQGAEKLIELVMNGLQPSGLDCVVDLYCGAGTFTLPLADAAQEVLAIESAGSSVRDLRRNLEANDLYAEVIGGDVARELPDLGIVDALVVDPPRSGLSQGAIERIVATQAKRIAYVSCNPTTLARDLVHLVEGGYHIDSVTPVDLFPQTYHVETVVLLTKTKR